MREIKFRLRVDNKIVGYEKWYSGHNMEDDPCSANPCWLYSKDGKKWFPTFIYHTQKDQCVNLKDKNNKEIYGGDIFKDNFGSIHSIEYDERRTIWVTSGTAGDNEIWRKAKKIEIIGNYQNPELLEDNQ